VARALYTAPPSAAEAAAFGLTVDEASGPPVEVWPDCLPAVNLFISLQTQWRSGYAGYTGLDYGCVPDVLRLMGVARRYWPGIFDDLRVMESAALETMHKGK
jgi:Phage related hypothetical protein (DUF1799)